MAVHVGIWRLLYFLEKRESHDKPSLPRLGRPTARDNPVSLLLAMAAKRNCLSDQAWGENLSTLWDSRASGGMQCLTSNAHCDQVFSSIL